jgi:hypothetical protein
VREDMTVDAREPLVGTREREESAKVVPLNA